MSIELPDLPYAIDALEPHMSARTLEFHHGKHHKAYVDKLNAGIAGGKYETQTLESIIESSHEANEAGIFNNAAQIWNHTFLWHSLSPNGGGQPARPLSDAIERKFGSMDGFRDAFKQAAMGQFGSGWAWLVRTRDGVDIMTTGNADTPLVHGLTPLLTLDVWEHAYYLDFQNRRDAYIDTFLDSLVDWEFATANYKAA
jgi:Fe-Mn family superoxide dismutase